MTSTIRSAIQGCVHVVALLALAAPLGEKVAATRPLRSNVVARLTANASVSAIDPYQDLDCKGDRRILTKTLWNQSATPSSIAKAQAVLLSNLSLDITEASATIAVSDPLRERRISAAGLLTQSLISMLAVPSPDSTIGYWRFISRTHANEGTPEMRVRSRALLKELAAQSAHAEIRDIARTALQHDVPMRPPN